MTNHIHTQSNEQNAASHPLDRHAIDGDYPVVSKSRCGMVLLKYESSHSFRCSNCNRDKVSKKIAFSQKDPTQLLCNACNGFIIAKNEGK